MIKKGDEVRYNLLSEGGEDFLSFHDLLWEVHETLQIWEANEVRAQTEALVKDNLERGFIVPGFPVGQGPEFAAWDLSVDETMAWIKRAWDELDREPVTGDICWFVTTEKGREWVRLYREMHPRLSEPRPDV